MIQSIEISRFIKGWTLGKLTGCENDFSHLVWPSREIFSYKEVQIKKFSRVSLWKPVAFLQKMLMKVLLNYRGKNVYLHVFWRKVKQTQFANFTLESMQSADSWFPWRNCRKVNHSSGALSFLVPSFLSTTFSGEGEDYSGTHNNIILLGWCQHLLLYP